jgi:hypothetical protein
MKAVSPVFLIVVVVLSIVFYVLYMRYADNRIEAEIGGDGGGVVRAGHLLRLLIRSS